MSTHPPVTSAPQPTEPTSTQTKASWVFGIVFGCFLLGVFVFGPPTLADYKQQILGYICASLAGFFALFFTGALLLKADLPLPGRWGVQASSGIALFLVVLFWWHGPSAPIKVDPTSKQTASSAPSLNSEKSGLEPVDVIDALGILRYVPKERRQEVCPKLLSADQCSRSQTLLSELEYQKPVPSQQKILSAAEEQGGVTKAQLQDLAACGGSFHFRVVDNLLVCLDGTPVPFLNGKNNGAMAEVDGLVFHSTASPDDSFGPVSELLANGLPDLQGSLAHLLVSRSGAVVQLIPFNRQAWHVGMSHDWNGTSLKNSNSIGVQLINRGPDSDEPFTPQQIEAAKGIAKAISAAYGIKAIVTHSEIVTPPGRKADPGPLFPISEIRVVAGLPNDK